ncbi:MAG: iron complex outermembrane receptor protein [Lysobacterales bacterium]|jgi:iron complex outermembrane receptor protein
MKRHSNLPLSTSLGTAILLAALISSPSGMLYAQQSSDAGDEGVLEEVYVTGSRIRRQDESSSSPVQTLSEEDLRVDGSLSIGETLQSLPSIGPSLNSNGSAGVSHGSSALNMRNLNPNRSLVLVNGHRWVNGAGTRGFRDFVDLNTIPQAMIERVEVLQDGATAIYGADAIAGVVNIHTYQNYEGGRIKAYYGSSSESDRDTTGLDVLFGKTFGNTNVTVALSYVDQEPIYSQDRALTAIPLNGLAAGTPEGLFRESGLAAVVGFTPPSAGITRAPGSDGNNIANWRPVVSATDRFNRYDNNYVVGPTERTSLFIQSNTETGNDMTFTVEALYNERKSGQLFSGAAPIVRGGSRGFVIANDPRVNPFGIEFSGSDFRIDNFFEDVGQRDNVQDVETTRLGIGLAGEFNNGWGWDTFVSTAQNKASFTSFNQLHLDKLALGLLACDTSGISANVSDISAGCVPVNMFNPLTPQMVDYIRFAPVDNNKAEQFDFTFNFTGELFEMPAGAVGFAAGIEYREEKGVDVPDSTNNSTPRVNTYRTTSSAPRDGTIGKYDLNEAYVEFDVPLVSGGESIEDFRLQAAMRYSDYSTFGSTTNGKIGFLLRPNDDFMIRGTFAEGFRAPSILELFEGTRSTSIPVSDPCSGGGGGIGCTGVPNGYVQPFANVNATVGGNPALQPETSENTSIGFVYTPSGLEGASFTLDWYNIDIENTISDYGAQNLLDLCSSSGQRCNFIQRDTSGEITNIADGPINLNRTTVEGLDLVGRMSTETRFGAMDYTLSLSHLMDLTEESTLPNGSVSINDKVGTAASREAFPEWRGMFTVRLANDDWTGSYSARYIGDTTEVRSGTSYHIGSVTYHNIAATYRFSDALNLKLGVDNVGDKQPPASRTNLNINFDINTYNAVGRFMYAQLNWDFEL